MLTEMLETYDENDESDVESDFEDLGLSEARRRRRRRPMDRRINTMGPGWQRQRPPVRGPGRTADQLKREAEAGRARDKQLAQEVNSTKEDVGDIASRLRKVNADLSSLRQISLLSMLLPRSLDIQRQNLTVVNQDGRPPALTTTTATGQGTVSTVSGVTSKLDILPLVLFMSIGKGIGKPGRSSGGNMGDNSMMLIVLLLLMQQQQQASGMQQQQQASGTPGQAPLGGLDSTMLLLVLIASGGL